MEWTEAWVREQAGWQAFKRGKELAEAGAVRSLRRRHQLVSGTFARGRRPIRCVAKDQGGLLAVECGCAANRSTGEICEHGVALVLASLTEVTPPQGEAALENADGTTPAPEPMEVAAYRVRLPTRAAEMLAAGRLQLRLEPYEDSVGEADRRFSAFLRQHGATGSSGLLTFSGDQVAPALGALAGHPRILLEQSDRRVQVAGGVLDPVPLLDSRLDDDRVQLTTAPGFLRLFSIGEEAGAVVEHATATWIGRLPVSNPSARWRDAVGSLCATGRVEIARDEFLEDIESWLDLFDTADGGWLGTLHFESTRPEHRLRLEGSLNALQATVELRYGSGEFTTDADSASSSLPALDGCRVRVRSRREEMEVVERLQAAGWEREEGTGRWRLFDPEVIPLWLADELPEIRRLARVEIGEKLDHVMQRLHVVAPRIEMGEGQSLSCELSFQTNAGRRLDPRKIRSILRKGSRSTRTRDGSVVVIQREASEVVEPLLADLGLVSGEQQFAITKAHAFLFAEYCKNTRKPLSSIVQREPQRVFPTGLVDGRLRAYQEAGVAWLFERIGELSGALLGDEMGLGKTIQTIALINWMRRSEAGLKVLLLVPTSLVSNWERELANFGRGLQVCRFTGAGRDDRRDEAAAAEVLLTSYGTFQRDRAFHLGRRYDLVVCDEASLLRNPDGQLSRVVAKLDAVRRLALSGTPIENRLEDLWSIFRFVAPGYLGARKEFSERYAGEAAGPAVRRRLALRISPYYLRRTKEEVAPDLPDKLVIDEWLELDDETRSLYRDVATAGLAEIEAMKSDGAARMHLLTLLLRLRQICLSPALVAEDHPATSAKVEWVRRLLEERHPEGGKTLVFSQFAGFLRQWEAAGEFAADHVFRLDGSTSNRGELVERFQTCSGSAVFLISLKAGGYGLNLTAADAVVHMDPWWNPAVENQGTDRAHRIGQSKPVSVYRLLARDTVEERVRRIQEQKRSLMDVAAGAEIATPEESWSEADLRSLL